jgi:hypothetical protein
MTKRGVDKHTIYHEVLEAMRGAKGCPLCRLEADSVRRYLDSLLYESVNDPGVRAELVRARGYCRRHAHTLAGMRDAFGIAILYQDQVRLFAQFLADLPDTPSRCAKQVREWESVERCPACRIQLECRERYASTLVGGLVEEEMRSAYSSGSGLCMPHFIYVLGETRDAGIYRLLVTVEQSKVCALLHDLEDFYRKHDYRFSQEGFGEEGDSWLRAIELIVGEDDGF